MSLSNGVVGTINSTMFHTIQFSSPPRPEQAQELPPKPSTNGVSKRITTPHACAECKRRKIRCDGRQPCGQCLGCRSPKPCYYDKHRQRVIPSRKTLEALSQSLEECRSILKRLYPNQEVQSLLPLSRQELISLLDTPISTSHASNTSPAASQTSPNSQSYVSPIPSASDDERGLANLEPVPQQDTEWDEERRNRDPIPEESDDVNALSLSVDRQASYLGASSIKAAFIVMLKVAPGLRSYLAPSNGSSTTKRHLVQISNMNKLRRESDKNAARILWSAEGQTLIDAYFNRVQVFIPMLDEPSFRATFLAGQRTDPGWLALLNMVFAMGSIVAMKSDDYNHVNFYNRAKEQLDLDSFGSGHIEALQALAIMGGYYLHYINRPNMANAICGAALRMACALGLHRESGSRECDPSSPQPDGSISPLEARRRTWWSLFILDTWGSTTLGRPSLGRWGPAITIRPPQGVEDPSALSSFGQHARIIPFIENIKFCKIATDIQDILAITALPSHEERNALDARLVHWHDSLPYLLRENTEACPEAILIARCVMKWRYQNLRIVLHRPVLLNIANRSGSSSSSHDSINGERKPSYTPSPEELAAVEKCRKLAKETIEDIYQNWVPNQMAGWNAVWFLYQASMIPLVSIFWEKWNTVQVLEWQNQIEMVLGLLAAMADWSLAARRSLEVVSKMYEASKRPLGPSGDRNHYRNSGAGSSSSGSQQVERSPGGTIFKREQGDTPRSCASGSSSGNMPGRGHHSGMEYPQGEIEGLRDVMIGEMQDGMEFMEHDSVWDLDGMLWSEGEVVFDGLPHAGRPFYTGMECHEQTMGPMGHHGLMNMSGNGGMVNGYDGVGVPGGQYPLR